VSTYINAPRVNSKAQLRVPFHEIAPLVPRVLHAGIMSSPYFASGSSSLLIQSDESRKQAQNREICYKKLKELLVQVYEDTVPGETSEEQKEKVKNLKEFEKEARLKTKKKLSSKKASRSKRPDD